MDFIEKQDDNMTIWQFDSITQNITDQIIITHIVKLSQQKNDDTMALANMRERCKMREAGD